MLRLTDVKKCVVSNEWSLGSVKEIDRKYLDCSPDWGLDQSLEGTWTECPAWIRLDPLEAVAEEWSLGSIEETGRGDCTCSCTCRKRPEVSKT